MELKTERLIIRELKDEDLSEMVRLIDNINVSRLLEKVVNPYTEEDGKWFVNHCKEEAKKEPRVHYELAIEFEGKFVGVISLSDVDLFQGTGSVGYWLGEDYWKQGLMTEAAREIIRFGFEDLGLRRIDIGAYVENEASNALIKKLGFQPEGVRKQYAKTKSTGNIYDLNIYGLLKENWKKA
jgi:[ribosomal protein S5]-alanine N-acetyltransferase